MIVTPTDTTKIFILAMLALWAVFDVFVMSTVGVEATISRVILAWHRQHPWIAFGTGIFIGHIFFPQPTPR